MVEFFFEYTEDCFGDLEDKVFLRGNFLGRGMKCVRSKSPHLLQT